MNKHALKFSTIPPLTKWDMMDEVRMALLRTASLIAISTTDEAAAKQFLGLDVSGLREWETPRAASAEIDPSRFPILREASSAYDYAYQRPDRPVEIDSASLHQLSLFHLLAGMGSFDEEECPRLEFDMLGMVLDTAAARWRLTRGGAVSVPELGLLANMNEAAVWASLHSEDLRPEGDPAELPANLAIGWLEKRLRPATPLRHEPGADITASVRELFETSSFQEALAGVMALQDIAVSDLVAAAKVDPDWFDGLLHGRPVACYIKALRRLAEHLKVDVPQFVGRAVQAILSHDHMTHRILSAKRH